MKVILALNGSVTSEASAVYAIYYCRLYDYALQLLHVKNGNDPIDEVERSMASIETLAVGAGVECERIFMNGKGVAPLIAYIRDNRIDTLFCTTRARKGWFARSFSDYVTRRPLSCDVAVVRIADLAGVNRIERIGVSIKNARLSVSKYAFFSSMVHAFEAEGEIYSISLLSRERRAALGFVETRERLERLDDRLGHYVHLGHMQQMPLRIKHAFAESEIEQILHHSTHASYDLLIVGGRRLSDSAFLKAFSLLEALMRRTGVNTIAHYPRGDSDG